MAFATSNIRHSVFGDLQVYAGDWTGNANDASGTITLNGGRVYLSQFNNQDADNPAEMPRVDVSLSGSTLTLTVHNHMDVTNGRFLVIFA